MAPPKPKAHGFTLVELAVVCAVVGLLATVAWPSWLQHLQRARRTDAVAALTRLQAAQERLRSNAGVYSADLATLQTAAISPEGLYTVAVVLEGPDGYRATATPRADRAQANDMDCTPLVLQVRAGFAEQGPTPACWHP